MRSDDLTCRYCGYRFETERDREAHIPCPERTIDLEPADFFRLLNANL